MEGGGVEMTCVEPRRPPSVSLSVQVRLGFPTVVVLVVVVVVVLEAVSAVQINRWTDHAPTLHYPLFSNQPINAAVTVPVMSR